MSVWNREARKFFSAQAVRKMASVLKYAVLVLFLTQIVVAPKKKLKVNEELVRGVMKRIIHIFLGRLELQSGTQFAVLALIPQEVNQPHDVDKFLAPDNNGITYRFTRPTRSVNTNYLIHAEIVAIESEDLHQFYDKFKERHGHPQFAVLYTWIHPCKECAVKIATNFGKKNQKPVWNTPMYIGYTTLGNSTYMMYPLTKDDHTFVKRLMAGCLLPILILPYITLNLSRDMKLLYRKKGGRHWHK